MTGGRPEPRRRRFHFGRVRVAEIQRLVLHRHGRLPDSDDAVIYLGAVAENLDHVQCDVALNVALTLHYWVRSVGGAVAEADVEHVARETPLRRRSADALGKVLRLTESERAACRITTFGAIDCTRAQRTARRKEKARERKRADRLAAGATPRAQSLSRTRPWEAEGVSRRTWERRRKARDASSSAANLPVLAADEVATTETPQRSAPKGPPTAGGHRSVGAPCGGRAVGRRRRGSVVAGHASASPAPAAVSA